MLDETYVLTLKLLAVDAAQVKNRVSETFHGPEGELARPLKHAIAELLGRVPKGQGELSIVTDLDELTVSIDGGEPVADRSKSSGPLRAGKHSLYLSADGYRSAARDVYIDDGATTKLRAELVELPGAWYTKWWLWTIVAGDRRDHAITPAINHERGAAGAGPRVDPRGSHRWPWARGLRVTALTCAVLVEWGVTPS